MNTQKPTEAVDVRDLIARTLESAKYMRMGDVMKAMHNKPMGLARLDSDAIITALSAAGYAIVSRVPTLSMISDGHGAGEKALGYTVHDPFGFAVWSAMISAAEKGK